MLKSSLCDLSDAYILFKGTISGANTGRAGAAGSNNNKKVIFKNCALFTDCINEINNTQVDNTKNIDFLISIYNLIEYSDNCSKIWWGLWKYLKDEPALNNNNITDFYGSNNNDSFNFKVKITGRTGNDGTKNVEIDVPLKYFSYCWRTLEIPLINCALNLILTWSVNCIIVSTNSANQAATSSNNKTLCSSRNFIDSR